MIWYDIEKETPELDELVLVAFKTNIGTIQYTTAKYRVVNFSAFCDNWHPVWYVEVSSGHEIRTVTHWANFDKCPIDNQDAPF